MWLREWTNNHPKAVTGLIIACVVLSIGWIVAQVLAGRHTIITAAPDHYYTVDDGKTFFKASQTNVPPFEYDNKTAVRACVFSCGGRLFVGYLERYTPEARQKELGPQRGSAELEINGRELKKPGEAVWISSSDHAALIKVTKITCPDGSSDAPVPIEP